MLISGIIDDQFVEALVIRKINLFRDYDRFFLQKTGDQIREIKAEFDTLLVNNQEFLRPKTIWKGVLVFLMNDCLKISDEKLSKFKLNEKEITDLVIEYNKCSGEYYQVPKDEKEFHRFSFGLTASLGQGRIHKKNVETANRHLNYPYRDMGYNFGIIVQYMNPKQNDKLFIQTGLEYSAFQFEGFTEYLIPPSLRVTSETEIRIQYLTIPISTNYRITSGRSNLYLTAGANFNFLINSSTRHYAESTFGTINPNTTSSESDAFDLRSSQFGLFTGIGTLQKIGKFTTSTSFRINHWMILNREQAFNLSNSYLGIHFAILR
ncbi:outer membrane beta-barrel protein [Gloeocapsopsis sp. IPPAS B-1203]|uniref:outer membrane beta-barrel protein n=1 Tax=Gloeocapsopsis sp. IPPAS B-1203 TaxID=2049454 RepID=UPI000C189F8F|nr:outer membrane beta-barrel protein [Gloeocapsopsis sp. IPPAS B-1203]PIG90440.1 hypothetical protein CSQ79_26655 [Gloeocapsopsis sp. IPPAS B-1203]